MSPQAAAPEYVKTPSKRWSDKMLTGIGVLCVGVTSVLLIVAYLRYKIPQAWFINSDAVYLAALFRDLFEEGGQLRDWSLSAAPYFVPDWPAYFLGYSLTGDPYLANVIFLVLQVCATFILTARIYGTIYRNGCDAWLGSATVTLILVTLTTGITRNHYHFLYFSVFHYGALLLSLLGLWIILRGLQVPAPLWRDCQGKYYSALGLLTLMASLSDALFVVQFTVASLLALAWLGWQRDIARGFAVGCAGAIVVGSGLGTVLYKWIVPNPLRPTGRLQFHHLAEKARLLHDFLVPAAYEQPLLAIALVTFYVLLLVWILKWQGPHKTCTPETVSRRFIAILTLGMMLSPLLAVLLVASIHTVSSRYMLPGFFLPVILGPALVVNKLSAQRLNTLRLTVVSLCLLLTLNYARYSLGGPGKMHRSYYPERVRCMDDAIAAHNLHYGLADYWDAKRLAMLSRRNITLASVTPMLYEYFVVNTRRIFRETYDFAIVSPYATDPDRLTEATVINYNGPPLQTIDCNGANIQERRRDDSPIRILVYPPNQLHALRDTH